MYSIATTVFDWISMFVYFMFKTLSVWAVIRPCGAEKWIPFAGSEREKRVDEEWGGRESGTD